MQSEIMVLFDVTVFSKAKFLHLNVFFLPNCTSLCPVTGCFLSSCAFVCTECRDVLLPMMLRELGKALASMADGPHDERRNSLELLNNILEVLSRNTVVR